jgi:predicted O-methyltransferase YrrM
MALRRRRELHHEDVAAIALEHLDSRESWQRFINAFRESVIPLADSADARLDDESLASLWSTMIVFLSHTALSSPSRKETLFREAQAMGLHVLPLHYSSPIPDTRTLSDRVWERELDARILGFDEDAGLELLARCEPYVLELDELEGYVWENPQFHRLDAALYYALVRLLQPRRVLEVGSGYSTQIASLAALRNGGTSITCIDPRPRSDVAGLPCLDEHVALEVQEVGHERFDALGRDDILFVDSSHTSRIGSDVNILVLELLPRLAPGVVVHVHDVFLPWEYPRPWVVDQQHFWSEQYLVAAFLSGNADWEVLFPGHFMARRRPGDVNRVLGGDEASRAAGSSLWLRRR